MNSRTIKIVLLILGILMVAEFCIAALPFKIIRIAVCSLFGDITSEFMARFLIKIGAIVVGFIGLFFIILSTNPTKYSLFVNLAVAGLLVIAAAITFYGPWRLATFPWHIVCAAIMVILAILIIIFMPRGKQ